MLWTEAIIFFNQLRNREGREIDENVMEPLLLQIRESDENIASLPEQDRIEFLASMGDHAIAILPGGRAPGCFVGHDKTAVNGIRISVGRKLPQPCTTLDGHHGGHNGSHERNIYRND